MSNTIQFPDVAIYLDPEHFDYMKLRVGQDADGNGLVVCEDGMEFYPAPYTTWRELRAFVRDVLVPAVKPQPEGGIVKIAIPECFEESDNFMKSFTVYLTVHLQPQTPEGFANYAKD